MTWKPEPMLGQPSADMMVIVTGRPMPGLLCAFAVWLVAAVPIGPRRRSPRVHPSNPQPGSDQTYQARRATTPIAMDGHADEAAWTHAVIERHFAFPWTGRRRPKEFRAVWDESYFYFTFLVQDADVVVLDRFRDEQDAVLEDRVESSSAATNRCWSTSASRSIRAAVRTTIGASFYRRFDPAWQLRTGDTGNNTTGRVRDRRSHSVDAIPGAGSSSRSVGCAHSVGLYRAEFSHDRSGRATQPRASLHTLGRESEGPPPIEDWASWVDPHTKEPDFHVPRRWGGWSLWNNVDSVD